METAYIENIQTAVITKVTKTPTRSHKSEHFDEKEHNDESDAEKSHEIVPASSCNLVNTLLEQIPDVDKYFSVHKKVGEGTFSCVFMASSKILHIRKKFAIKHLYPTSHPSRILQELKCLKDIGGCDNVVGLDLCFRNRGSVAFIMPYFPHDSFSNYVLDMNVQETKLYMKNLLIALRRVHSFNIIHRDVKPNNFLYNRVERRFLLVDFGLSHSVEEYEKSTTVGKRRKRDLDSTEKELSGNDRKRPVLNSLSTNIQEFNDSRDSSKKSSNSKNTFKKKTPIYKENSPHSMKNNRHRDIRHVKRNLQFGNLATEIKNDMVNAVSSPALVTKATSSIVNIKFQSQTPELTRFRLSLSKEGSSFVRLQNSQVKSRYSISGSLKGGTQSSSAKSYYPLNRCGCDGNPRICNTCVVRKAMNAPRAGTPGYRSPEVLLRYPNQTTAIDIWSAGVIMISIMTGSYPFFRAPDDITALMEIISIFGTEAIVTTAKKLGRTVLSNKNYMTLNLRKLCERLRHRDKKEKVGVDKLLKCNSCNIAFHLTEGCLCANTVAGSPTSDYTFPDSAYDLLQKLLTIDPFNRISADQAIKHPFFKEDN